MSCAGDNWIVPGANPCAGGGGGEAGVSSLNSFTGAVNITAGNENIGVSNEGGTIVLNPAPMVNTLNLAYGDLEIAGDPTGSVVVSVEGSEISLYVPNGVTSLNSLIGDTRILGGTDISVDVAGQDLTLNFTGVIPAPGVATLNTLTGVVTCTSSDGSLLVDVSGSDIDFTIVGTAPAAGVTSINSIPGVLNILGGTDISVDASGQDLTVNFTGVIPSAVESLNSETGAITIAGGGATTIATTPGTITITSPVTGVLSLTTQVSGSYTAPADFNFAQIFYCGGGGGGGGGTSLRGGGGGGSGQSRESIKFPIEGGSTVITVSIGAGGVGGVGADFGGNGGQTTIVINGQTPLAPALGGTGGVGNPGSPIAGQVSGQGGDGGDFGGGGGKEQPGGPGVPGGTGIIAGGYTSDDTTAGRGGWNTSALAVGTFGGGGGGTNYLLGGGGNGGYGLSPDGEPGSPGFITIIYSL
jgi:hypothetical protein